MQYNQKVTLRSMGAVIFLRTTDCLGIIFFMPEYVFKYATYIDNVDDYKILIWMMK